MNSLSQLGLILLHHVTLAGLVFVMSQILGCSPAELEYPISTLDRSSFSPYVQEVQADEPVDHWRLDQIPHGAVKGDTDGYVHLTQGEKIVLKNKDLGGKEFSVELWLRNANGNVLSFMDEHENKVFALDVSHVLQVSIYGNIFDTGIVLSATQWQHLGVSWSISHNFLNVVIDGVERFRTEIKRDQLFPLNGRLILGGLFSGDLDEVVTFDKSLHSSQWLHRHNVAKLKSRPSLLLEEIPQRIILPNGEISTSSQVSWHPAGYQFWMGGKIWDAQLGGNIYDLSTKATWNADGSKLATINEVSDGKSVIKVLHSQSYAELFYTDGTSYSWSPDGTQILIANDYIAEIRDSETGRLIRNFDASSTVEEGLHIVFSGSKIKRTVGFVSWSPTGDKLVTTSSYEVKVWDLKTGKLLHTLKSEKCVSSKCIIKVPSGDIQSVTWNRQGTRLATTAKKDQSIKIWNIEDGTLVSDEIEQSSLKSLQWSPDGKNVRLNYRDLLLKIWNVEKHAVSHKVKGSILDVTMGMWDSEGVWLDAANGIYQKVYRSLRKNLTATTKVFLSPDGRRVVTADKKKIKLWGTKTGAMIYESMISEAIDRQFSVHSVSLSPDGFKVAIGDKSGFRIRDLRTGISLYQLSGELIAWSPDGSMIATGSYEGSLQLWDSGTGKRLAHLTGLQGMIKSIFWSPDSKSLFTETRADTDVEYLKGEYVNIWSIHTAKWVLNTKGRAITWSPDGKQVALVNDGVIELWYVETGQKIGELKFDSSKQKTMICALAWHPKEDRLLSSSNNGMARLWNTSKKLLLLEVNMTKQKSKYKDYCTAAWSPTGEHFAVSVESLELREGKTGLLHKEFELEHESTFLMEWNRDGSQIAYMSASGLIKIRNSHSGELLLASKGKVMRKPFSWSQKQKDKIVIADDQGTASFWDTLAGSHLTLYETKNQNWLLYDDQGYFTGTLASRDLLGITSGSSRFNFGQVATLFNRPDVILEKLGAPKSVIEFYQSLWHRRLSRLEISNENIDRRLVDAPTVRLDRVSSVNDNGEVELSMSFSDRTGLKGFQILINGVPLYQKLYHIEGIRSQADISIQLNAGNNVIDIFALNTESIESLHVVKKITYDGKDLPQPKLFFLGFGVSDYLDDQLDLRFAHKDVLDLEAELKRKVTDFVSIQTMTFIDDQVTSSAFKEAPDF